MCAWQAVSKAMCAAAGSRMRGHVEFGWEDEKGKIKGLVSNGS